MADIEALWASHERRIREVLAWLGDAITAEVRDEIEYMVDKREYGIALEGLLSEIKAHSIDVDTPTRAILAEIAADMGGDWP